ncbi:hypothetical protein CAL7716_082070 [Calothrix sp. PCC 7716]|nr:hypothetical protein CAL7716_082070 [Calothrix sp. PCC 7716]
MNSNQVSSSRVNSSLKATTYASYNQHLSKQYILRAQLGFINLPLTSSRALVASNTNTMSG